MRNYPVYAEGAVFYDNDFDPYKVILTASRLLSIDFSEETIAALSNRKYNSDAINEICTKIEIAPEHIPETINYDLISTKLLEDKESLFFEKPKEAFGGNSVEPMYFTDVSGEFILAYEPYNVRYCFDYMVISFQTPYIWDLADYKGPKTIEETIAAIREGTSLLLKDNIDWEKRLGCLIGSYYG